MKKRKHVGGRHAFLKSLINDFENNPKVQFKFHRIMMYFWMLNAIVATSLFIFFQSTWLQIGVFYVLLLSLYANWDTDFDAMSASGAWIEAKELREIQK